MISSSEMETPPPGIAESFKMAKIGRFGIIEYLIQRRDLRSLKWLLDYNIIPEYETLFKQLCWLIKPEYNLTDDEYQKILTMIKLIADRLGEKTFETYPAMLTIFAKFTEHPAVAELLVRICTTDFGFKFPDRFENISSYLIHHAIFANNFLLIKAVFEKYGKNFGRDEYLLLSEATKLHRIEIVEFLISNGVNPSVTDLRRNTALHHCSCPEIGSLLMGNRADIEARNNLEETPLILACKNKRFKMVGYLITHNVNPSLKDHLGNTALHYCPSPEIGSLLMGNGADIEARNKLGQTPLMLVCGSHRVEMVDYFVNTCGADPKAVDANGRNAESHTNTTREVVAGLAARILAILNGTSGESAPQSS